MSVAEALQAAAEVLVVSHAFLVSAPPERVFPLFTAEREAEWAEGWAYDGLAPRPFRTGTNAVFRTSLGGRDEVWTVIEYDARARRVEYVAVWRDHLVRRVRVACTAAEGSRGTRVEVAYTLIPLDAIGAERAATYDRSFLRAWEAPVRDAVAADGRGR